MAEQAFLECTSEYFSIHAFTRIINSYIPPTILNKVPLKDVELNGHSGFKNDGAEHVQKLFDKSNYQLRMYGSVKELCENIKIYRNVSSDYKLFSFDWCEPLSTMSSICKGSSGEMYMCKQDVFVYIQNFIFAESEIIPAILFCRSFLVLFMRLFGGDLDYTYEFVKFSDPIFKEIRRKLGEAVQDQACYVMGEKYPKQFKSYTYSGILKRFVELLPVEWNDEKYKELGWSLEETLEHLPPTTKAKYYDLMIVSCVRVTKALQDIFEGNSRIFMPNSKLLNETNVPKIVRIFEDGPHTFVPLNELKVLLGEAEYSPNRGVMETIPESVARDMVKSKFGENLKHIEFIRFPIIRAKHRSAIIRDSKGLPHKLAIDVFLEVLYELIFGMKVFQRVQGNELDSVEKMFSNFDKYLQTTGGNVRILQIKAIVEIENFARNKFEYLTNRPAKDVRNAKKDGFTVQNLKNELIHLGLVNTFPDILDYAQIVYDTIVKRTPVLTTAELFEAVFQCQIICFFKKYPKWTKFVHDQKGCDRVFYLDKPSVESEEKPKAKSSVKDLTAAELLAKLPESITSDTFIRLVKLSDGTSAETSPKTEASQPPTTSTTKSVKESVAKQSTAQPIKTTLSGSKPSATPTTLPKPDPIVKPTPSSSAKQIAQPSTAPSIKLSVEPSKETSASTSTSPEPFDVLAKMTKSQKEPDRQSFFAEARAQRVQRLLEAKKRAKEEARSEIQKVEAQPESANCTKCPRTCEVCQEAKKKLETCEKKMAAAEKELKKYKEQGDWKKVKREMEKELEESKKKVIEMEKQMKNMKVQGDKKVEKLKEQAETLRTSNKAEQEKAIAEREDLQKKLTDLRKTNEEWGNKYRDLSLLSSEKDLTIQKLQREMAASWKPSVEMRRVLADLQDQFHNTDKLVSDTRRKIMRLIHLPTSESVKQRARDEEAVFLHKHAKWEQAIMKNMAMIQGKVHVTQEDLVPVPETPGLSVLLENELVIAEKKNESLGKECLVCREEKLRGQNLFKCPHCPTTFHLKCLTDWIKYDPRCQCPVCKMNLNCRA